MADSMKKIANEEVTSLKKSWTKERSKLRRDVKEWRMRYHAESLWQVDVSTLKCELVNCGYRKEAATQQRRIDQLEKQVASLSSDLREYDAKERQSLKKSRGISTLMPLDIGITRPLDMDQLKDHNQRASSRKRRIKVEPQSNSKGDRGCPCG